MSLQTQYAPGEIVTRGKALYESRIRRQAEAGNIGKYLAITIDTGEWELGTDHSETILRAYDKFPTAGIYGMRIGYPAAEAIGGGLRPFGLCAGEFTVPDDFDDPLPDDILKAFNCE